MMLVLLRFMRWSLAVACVCIGVVGIVVVFVGGVIDGNGDGIWWQVLAVAFRRHWAVGKSWRWTAYHRRSSRDATLQD